MKLLLTNDDGWDAPGIMALAEVAREFGDVWIAAPDDHVSGISHQLTWFGNIRLSGHGNQTYSIAGTPADCVRLGLNHLGVEFDWVLSGVNNGANLGADIYMSGTVAAAREAALLGCRALAISQHRKDFQNPEFDWRASQEKVKWILAEYCNDGSKSYAPGFVRNINLPDLPVGESCEILECNLDRNPLPVTYKQSSPGVFESCPDYNGRSKTPGFDVEACFAGRITVTGIDFVTPAEALVGV